MPVQLRLTNQYVYITGLLRADLRALEKATSYLVQGFMFAPGYKAKRWDGREHLLTYSKKYACHRAPIGLLDDIIQKLRDLDEEPDIFDERRYHGPTIRGAPDPIPLRPYQKDAVDAMEKAGWSGLLEMPIRSGKTRTAAAIIDRIGRRALFIVPSAMLLRQTKRSFEEHFDQPIGTFGDNECDIQDITVATIQSIDRQSGGTRLCDGKNKCGRCPKEGHRFRMKNKLISCPGNNLCMKCHGKHEYNVPATKFYKELADHFDVMIMDEAHHLKAGSWHKTFMGLNATHRIGLTATAFLDNDRQAERGVIWLKACCGPVRFEVDMSLLIEQGYLMRQNVEIYRIDKPEGFEDRGWGASLRDRLVNVNRYRNQKIINIARSKAADGLKTIIVSGRFNQIDQLAEIAEQFGLSYHVVTGRSSPEQREVCIRELVSGEVDVLIGTVFREGLDIPEVECVINAEGGVDIVTTIQRMRNMTMSEGKTTAVLVDFADLTNRYFAKHSKARIDAYRDVAAFNVRLVDDAEFAAKIMNSGNG